MINRITLFLQEVSNFEKRHDIHITPNEKMQMLNIVPIQPVDVHIVLC